MLKVWASLASALFATAAFGQSAVIEAGQPMPPDASCMECAPACRSCWDLHFSIPKRPIRSWFHNSACIQKTVDFCSYQSGKCGTSCCLKPDSYLNPPLYTYFWPIHCGEGGACGGCRPQHGIWVNEPIDGGFASAGAPIGRGQPSYANAPKNPEHQWLKSMWPQWRNDKEAAIMPASAEFTNIPQPMKR